MQFHLHGKSLVSVCLLFTQVSVVNIFYSSDKFKASGESEKGREQNRQGWKVFGMLDS
jgi:hypothetical protein